MAKVLIDNVPQSQITKPYYSLIKGAVTGAVMGILYWSFTSLIQYYFKTSITISGNIASILVLTIGIFSAVWLKLARPLLITIATAISLWGLADWANGLQVVEKILWSALIYGLAYVLFLWIVRMKKTSTIIITIIILILLLHIFTAL